MLGGETRQNSLNPSTGYSTTAQPSYLKPNSSSMQKPIGGRSTLAFYTLFKGEAAAVLGTAENKTTHFDTLLMPHHQCFCGIPFGKTEGIPKTHIHRKRTTNLAKNSTNQTTQNHHTTAQNIEPRLGRRHN